MAMQASGNEVVANGYFQQAQNLDPAGRRGLLARAAAGDRAVLR
jgi:hypothetical protein